MELYDRPSAVTYQFKGKYSIPINFIKHPYNPNLICSICKGFPRQIVQARPCGDVFCHECLQTYLRVYTNCPKCKIELERFDTIHPVVYPGHVDLDIMNQWYNQEIICTLGCQFKSDYLHMEIHEETECPKRLVHCKWNQCERKGTIDEIIEHETFCSHRFIFCTRCGIKRLFRDYPHDCKSALHSYSISRKY